MSKPAKIIPEKLLSFEIPEVESEFSSKDGIIYALGIKYSLANPSITIRYWIQQGPHERR